MSDDLVNVMNVLLLIESGLDEKLAQRVSAQWKAKCEELTEARAEIETKTQAIADMARQMYEMQSELSTLRARVREVVGPFAEIAESEAFQFQTREWRDLVIAKPTGTRLAFVQADSFRAARQLNEDLKG